MKETTEKRYTPIYGASRGSGCRILGILIETFTVHRIITPVRPGGEVNGVLWQIGLFGAESS